MGNKIDLDGPMKEMATPLVMEAADYMEKMYKKHGAKYIELEIDFDGKTLKIILEISKNEERGISPNDRPGPFKLQSE